jgi:hypothetical protein
VDYHCSEEGGKPLCGKVIYVQNRSIADVVTIGAPQVAGIITADARTDNPKENRNVLQVESHLDAVTFSKPAAKETRNPMFFSNPPLC